MKRLALTVAALAGFAAPASAQLQAQRDGKVEQAILDTVGASLIRRGLNNSTQVEGTYAGIKERIGAMTNLGASTPQSNVTVPAAERTFQHLIKGLAAGGKLPYPLQVGKVGDSWAWYPTQQAGMKCFGAFGSAPTSQLGFMCYQVAGGEYGGGGATGAWGPNGKFNCASMEIRLDATGFLIIPSAPARTGGPIKVGDFPYWGPAADGDTGTAADSYEALALRILHEDGMNAVDKRRYWGIQAFGMEGSNGCAWIATVGYVNDNGTVVPRSTAKRCYTSGVYSDLYQPNESEPWYHPYRHDPCPTGEGGSFHFYGKSGGYAPGTAGRGHIHSCLMYAPTENLGHQGYAVNPNTTVNWKNHVPPAWPGPGAGPIGNGEAYRQCLLDPSFIKRISDALYKDASLQSGFQGVPYQPITDTDSRPGDAIVEDLRDTPNAGTATPTQPGPGVNDPPPPTTVPGTTTGSTDTCDFGSGGCDNPGTPAPSLGEVPTGIMDPIFDWLPDLPSITLNSQAMQCPTWALNLTDYMGPQGQWLLDSHCPLVEQNAAIISALMLALFGIGAAMIILRA